MRGARWGLFEGVQVGSACFKGGWVVHDRLVMFGYAGVADI